MQQFNNFRAGDVPVSYMLQGMFQQSLEEASPACVAGCAEPCVRNPPKGAVSLLLFRGSPHTPGSEWEQGRIPLGHGGGTWPWSLPATLLREWGQTPPCQGRVGPVPGGCQRAQRAPCCLPLLLPPFSQHFVPTVNYKYISRGGRSSDKPCRSGCTRALLPVCWPWHSSHSLCRKSQRST